jgi:hypothetical protein
MIEQHPTAIQRNGDCSQLIDSRPLKSGDYLPIRAIAPSPAASVVNSNAFPRFILPHSNHCVWRNQQALNNSRLVAKATIRASSLAARFCNTPRAPGVGSATPAARFPRCEARDARGRRDTLRATGDEFSLRRPRAFSSRCSTRTDAALRTSKRAHVRNSATFAEGVRGCFRVHFSGSCFRGVLGGGSELSQFRRTGVQLGAQGTTKGAERDYLLWL